MPAIKARKKVIEDSKAGEAQLPAETNDLQEARNTAEWLESRLHLALTQFADDLFGGGNITRAERIALSGAIGGALDVYHQSLLDSAPQLFERGPWDYPPEDTGAVSEGAKPVTTIMLHEEFTPLAEKALRRDGSIPIKIIQPGWGSSGYYGPQVLERDGARAFPAGAKMFWNHPSASEESDRPERDLNDLAAELISPARYDAKGPKGPGLYADAKVFEAYQAAVDSLAGSIGLSIRASGKAQQGVAEGRSGPIITELVPDEMNTVDFVTYPGAGGEVITMFEAARTVRADKKTEPGAVPVSGATTGVAISESETEDDMDLKELQEAVATLQASDAKKTAENARLQEALAFRDAKDLVREALAKLQQLPTATRARLLESLPRQAVITEGKLDIEQFGKVIEEAIKAEVQYLAEAAGLGNIKGLGESVDDDDEPEPEKVEEALADSFGRMGLKESTAKLAARGRG